MVARVDYAGVVRKADRLKLRQHLPYIIVQETSHAVVRGDGDATRFVRKEIVIDLAIRQCLGPGMPYIIAVFAPLREGNFSYGIHLVKFWWRDQWKMRTDEGHEYNPGLVSMFRRFCLQPIERVARYVSVIVEVG